MSRGGDWRPSASRERLIERAALLARTRQFFAARGVLEVDTPLLVNAPVSDVHIHCAAVQLAPAAGAPPAPAALLFLHASPEYAMKRLLAAGSGDIYQICHVVRARESSRLHNPEFTLIEWYRVGFSLEALMDEVEALVRELLGPVGEQRASERISYRDAFTASSRWIRSPPPTPSWRRRRSRSASRARAPTATCGSSCSWVR